MNERDTTDYYHFVNLCVEYFPYVICFNHRNNSVNLVFISSQVDEDTDSQRGERDPITSWTLHTNEFLKYNYLYLILITKSRAPYYPHFLYAVNRDSKR